VPPLLPREGLYIFTKAELVQATNGYGQEAAAGHGRRREGVPWHPPLRAARDRQAHVPLQEGVRVLRRGVRARHAPPPQPRHARRVLPRRPPPPPRARVRVHGRRQPVPRAVPRRPSVAAAAAGRGRRRRGAGLPARAPRRAPRREAGQRAALVRPGGGQAVGLRRGVRHAGRRRREDPPVDRGARHARVRGPEDLRGRPRHGGRRRLRLRRRAAGAGGDDEGAAADAVVDCRLGPAWDRPTVRAVFALACRCVRPYKNERPEINEVLAVLRAALADYDSRANDDADEGSEGTASYSAATLDPASLSSTVNTCEWCCQQRRSSI
jgi:hypothetical protein